MSLSSGQVALLSGCNTAARLRPCGHTPGYRGTLSLHFWPGLADGVPPERAHRASSGEWQGVNLRVLGRAARDPSAFCCWVVPHARRLQVHAIRL